RVGRPLEAPLPGWAQADFGSGLSEVEEVFRIDLREVDGGPCGLQGFGSVRRCVTCIIPSTKCSHEHRLAKIRNLGNMLNHVVCHVSLGSTFHTATRYIYRYPTRALAVTLSVKR